MTDQTNTVKEYLKRNGYPLEMYVAKHFRNAGFEVYQSSIYVDKETGKDREIDVTAYYWKIVGNIQFTIKIIIECKFAKNLWVLFSGENPGFDILPFNTFYCSNYAGTKLLETLSTFPMYFQSPFIIQQKFGYGLIEATKNDKEQETDGRTTYKAISTLLNSLHFEKTSDQNKKVRSFEIYVPIIVIQGKLFECYLDLNDEEIIKEINEGQLIYKSNVYPGVFPIIEIITKGQVETLAKTLYKKCENILTREMPKIQHLINHFPTDPSLMIT